MRQAKLNISDSDSASFVDNSLDSNETPKLQITTLKDS